MLRVFLLPHSSVRPLFCFNDTATTEIYTLSLHDALPISRRRRRRNPSGRTPSRSPCPRGPGSSPSPPRASARAKRSEEHTSELQSLRHLVCRLLLEKKKNKKHIKYNTIQKIIHNTRLDEI